jgi:uncharacterized membrane protein
VTNATPHRRKSAKGQVSLLIIGFSIVLVMMVAVVVDASAAYLRRQGMDSLADGAALSAADGVRAEQVYSAGLGKRAEIDPAAAERYAAGYLSATGARQRYPGLELSVDVTADSVVVTVAAPLELPITPPGWATRPVVSARAAAFVVVAD